MLQKTLVLLPLHDAGDYMILIQYVIIRFTFSVKHHKNTKINAEKIRMR